MTIGRAHHIEGWIGCKSARAVLGLLLPTAWLMTIIFNAVLPGVASGGEILWQSIGPGGGGWMQSIACDTKNANRVFAGSDLGGFYFSDNGGESWQIRNKGLGNYFVATIAVHPAGDYILIGTQGGLYQSRDHGLSWQAVRNGFPAAKRHSFSAPVSAIAFNPAQPSVVLAGIGRPRWTKGGLGEIYRSTDSARTWQSTAAGSGIPARAIIYDIAFSSDGRYCVAATDHGVFRSGDNGQLWEKCSNGLPHDQCRKLALSRSSSNTVYLTLKTMPTGRGLFKGGVYRSDDGGFTWYSRNGNLPFTFNRSHPDKRYTTNYADILVHPDKADTVYVGATSWVHPGVYRSSDGGNHWTFITLRENMEYGWITQWGPSVTAMAMADSDSDVIYFGTPGHVFRTVDGGATWQQRYCQMMGDKAFIGNGLETSVVTPNGIAFVSEDRLLVGFYDIGLTAYDRKKQRFMRQPAGIGASRHNVAAIAIDPGLPDRYWFGYGGRKKDSVYRATVAAHPDGQRQIKASGLPQGATVGIVVDPASPLDSRTLYIARSGHGIFKSVDGGKHWQNASSGLPLPALRHPVDLIIDSTDSKNLRCYIGLPTDEGAGLYESVDGAGRWHRVATDNSRFANVKSLTADPNNWDTMFIAQREFFMKNKKQMITGGVLKSTDGGKTWDLVYINPFVSALAVSPVDGQTMYIGTTDHPYHDVITAQGVLKSSNGGLTWQEENTYLTTKLITSIVISPHRPDEIFLGTAGNGLFWGKDRGAVEIEHWPNDGSNK